MSVKKAGKSLFSFLFLCSSILIYGQPSTQTFNPYSRYGIGEIENKGFAPTAAMGRAVTAFENDDRDSLNPVILNPANPASYASLRLTDFEVGVKTDFNFLENSKEKLFKNNTYLSYLSFGFPLGKRAGVAVGITPFSNVGYTISDVNNDPNIGDVTTIYEGTGGLNQVFFGLGYRPFQKSLMHFLKSKRYDSLRREGKWDEIRKKRFFKAMASSFAIGANGYFMFGDLNNTTSVIFPSSATPAYFNVRRIRATRVSDFYSSYGALVSFRIDSIAKKRKDIKVTLGTSVYVPTQLSANYKAVAYTYKQFGANIAFPYDTSLNVERNGTIGMPLIMSFGLAVRKGIKLTVMGDVSLQNWSYYRFFDEDPKLRNSIRYSLGFQYANNGEWKTRREMIKERAMYRAGAFYNTGYLDLKDTRIGEYGFSVGVGLPLGLYNKFFGAFNQINISAEFGQWGTTQNNLVQNKFIRGTIGLTLNQKWFLKRVID